MEKKYEVPKGDEDFVERSLIELDREHGVRVGLVRGTESEPAVVWFYGRASSIESAVRALNSGLREPLKEAGDAVY